MNTKCEKQKKRMNVYLHVSFLCTALFHPIYPQFIRAYIEKWKKKLYLVYITFQ